MTRATRIRLLAPAATVLALIAAGCGGDSNGAVPEASRTVGASTPAAPSTGQRLQASLDAAVELDADVTGVLLHVDAPGISWSGAAGVADRATGAPLEPDAPFRIASNTKTFTAAAVYRLQELGELDVDDRISTHLPARLVAQLPGGDRITVRQLLEHTSGLYDYATDPAYVEVVLSRPAHRWTPREQVRFALEHGKPYGAPGETFHYSDTGYVLAGEIIEQVTGQPLAEALRSLLGFDRLGLGSTWLESVEAVPAGASPRAHQYFGDLDTYDFDPSFDLFGGGGLVSTTTDLARFWRALFAGEVYEQPGTLAEMLTVRRESAAAGLFRLDVGGHTGWQHGGFWGSEVVHVPDLDLTIALSVGQAGGAAAGEVTEHLLAGLGSVLELG